MLNEINSQASITSTGSSGNNNSFLDGNEYAIKFFQRYVYKPNCYYDYTTDICANTSRSHRVLSCTHVIGMNFSYITACNYNRRAFVCCCIDAFQSFPPALEMTVLEAYHILRLICVDFPRVRIEEAIFPVVGNNDANTRSSGSRLLVDNHKCLIHTLQAALYFSILYENWIGVVRSWFEHVAYNTPLSISLSAGASTDVNMGTSKSINCIRVVIPLTQLNLQRLNQQLTQWRSELPNTFLQPHKDAITSVIAMLTQNTANGNMKTLSLDQFLKAMLSNPIVEVDLFRKPLHCQNVQNTAK